MDIERAGPPATPAAVAVPRQDPGADTAPAAVCASVHQPATRTRPPRRGAGARDSAPAANTSADTTSSRAAIDRLISRIDPWSSVWTLATARDARTSDRHSGAHDSGPSAASARSARRSAAASGPARHPRHDRDPAAHDVLNVRQPEPVADVDLRPPGRTQRQQVFHARDPARPVRREYARVHQPAIGPGRDPVPPLLTLHPRRPWRHRARFDSAVAPHRDRGRPGAPAAQVQTDQRPTGPGWNVARLHAPPVVNRERNRPRVLLRPVQPVADEPVPGIFGPLRLPELLDQFRPEERVEVQQRIRPADRLPG